MRRRCIAALMALALAAPAAPAEREASPSPRIPLALDHASVAVADLAAAAAAYAKLGFTLKPGRPHANSIANRHCKFLDGTELELITAVEPRDSLAAEYLRFLAQGDGGAFAALRCAGIESLAARLGEPLRIDRAGPLSASWPQGHPLRCLWFLQLPRIWVDRPEYTGHANTAQRLRAVWIRRDRGSEVDRLCAALGYEARAVPWPQPGSRAIGLDTGEIYVVPVDEGYGDVAGVTIEVMSIRAVEAALAAAEIPAAAAQDERGKSLRVAPADAHGVWLEFLEPTQPASRAR
jgi:hypothetical protein